MPLPVSKRSIRAAGRLLKFAFGSLLVLLLAEVVANRGPEIMPVLRGQTVERISPFAPTGRFQPYQSPFNCLPCHARQFRENRQNVKSGYRNVSPAFNSLELAGNFLAQAAVEADPTFRNLRPVYPPEQNLVTAREGYENANQVRSGFCIGCHSGPIVGLGDNNDINAENVARREIPGWDGRFVPLDPEDPQSPSFIDGQNIRPLRDYHLTDAAGNQVLPAEFGGAPPPGARPSQGAFGVSCDHCHNVTGPATTRSLQGDGFANAGHRLLFTTIKVGPFKNAFPVRGSFHQSTSDESRINFLRSSLFCNSCHDVRVPNLNVVVAEDPTTTPGVPHYRLENLGTEWRIGPYADRARNPFNQVVRCQDCHMSLYPYGGDATYTVTDPVTGEELQITSPRPAVFATNFAAEPGVSTPFGIPLPARQVATHYFTGIDVPLLRDEELQTRLGDDYPSTDESGVDEYGIPLALRTRREDLLKASVRMDLNRSDRIAQLGRTFKVRVRLVALTGHRFPSGFSQERSAWVQLVVSAKRRDLDEEFVLYRSGYLVDKGHPEVGEPGPDGNLHDEDQEHTVAIVNPFTHDNEVFFFGPDDGPHARIFEGAKEGLIFFRNELLRVYGPDEFAGHPTGIGDSSRLHPRTGEVLEHPLEEETFSAGVANAVDNWRSLPPLLPRTYTYAVELPSADELAELGIELEGPLRIQAALHFQHFPPLFLRFLARVAGAVVEKNLHQISRLEPFTGLRGPANRDYHLFDETRIDELLRIVFSHQTTELTVPLEIGE